MQWKTLIMLIALLQVRMMKWCNVTTAWSKLQSRLNIMCFFSRSVLFGWMCFGLRSEINFLLGKIKCGPYPALTYIRLTANRKSSYGVRKGTVNFSQSRLGEKLKCNFLLSAAAQLPVTRLLSTRERKVLTAAFTFFVSGWKQLATVGSFFPG